MKTVKIDDVHYQMLVDVGKRWKMRPDALVEELIQETKKTFDQSMHLYEQTLNQVVQASGNGVSHDTSDRTKTIRVGDPVAVRCSDNTDYYRTVLIRKNQFSNSFQALVSNPVAGTIPPGMDEVP